MASIFFDLKNQSKTVFVRYILILAILSIPFFAQASISITGTRVIYNEDDRSVSVKMTNQGKMASIVQAWIDDKMTNQSPSQGESPFLLYPSVSKIVAGGEQFLRIKKIENIPNVEVESVYWLNIKAIPEAPENPDTNYLQFSVLSKLKLFYRPAALKGKASEIYKDISWHINTKNGQSYLMVKNNSRFYASFTEVRVKNQENKNNLSLEMVAPKSNAEWLIKGISLADIKNNKTEYGLVNDYGAVVYRPIIIE